MIAIGVGLCAALIGVRLQAGRLLGVQTGSMEPAIHRGDLAVVLPAEAVDIRRGDIVTFVSHRDSTKTVTHRVIETPERGIGTFQTKGDANRAPDQPVASADIVGKVAYTVPKLGYVSDFIRTPIGLSIVIYMPGLLIIGAELRRLVQYYHTQQLYIAPWRRRQKTKVRSVREIGVQTGK